MPKSVKNSLSESPLLQINNSNTLSNSNRLDRQPLNQTINSTSSSSNQIGSANNNCSLTDVFCECKLEMNYTHCVCQLNPFAAICDSNYCADKNNVYECNPNISRPYSCFNSGIMTTECECLLDYTSESCFCHNSINSISCRLEDCNPQTQILQSDSRFCKCRKEKYQNQAPYYCKPDYCLKFTAGCEYLYQNDINATNKLPLHNTLEMNQSKPYAGPFVNTNQPYFTKGNDQLMNTQTLMLSRNSKIVKLYSKQLEANNDIRAKLLV
jgi:hypothetical protein